MPGLCPINELPAGSFIKLQGEKDPTTWIILKQDIGMAHIWPLNSLIDLTLDLTRLKQARLGAYGWLHNKSVWCVVSPPMRLSIGDSNAG